ncbi:MAG TPA: hypothetical protein VLT47_08590 [Anaeromyxobacteraceae bacterium]|nr:hypothetical protein [Anaeromyxobacteraceae bacterium]
MLRRLSADTAMIVGCALSWGVALALVIWLDGSLGFRAFAWSGWEFLPAGAFACGVVAGSGGFLGLALSKMRPTPLGVALPAIAGASVPASFYWLLWYFGPVGAPVPPSASVPMLHYLGAALSDPAFHPSAGAVTLQFLGAFVGGAVTSAVVLWVDACPRCSELMSDAGALERYVDDATRLTRMNAAGLDEPDYVSMLAALEKRPHGLIRVTALLKLCKHCGMGEIVERRQQHSARGWGRPVVRRKYGARAPALVRWFVPAANAAPQVASAGQAPASRGAAPSP